MPTTNHADTIRQAMNQVRNKRSARVSEVQAEAERVVDWREYVRAAPFTAVAASTVAGFFLVSAAWRSAPKARTPTIEFTSTTPQHTPSMASGLLQSVFLPMFVSAAKSFISSQLTQLITKETESGDTSKREISQAERSRT